MEPFWKNFIREYRKTDIHWYVSKAKTYDIESFLLLKSALLLLNKWFVEADLLSQREIQHIKNYLKDPQLNLIPQELEFKRWNNATQLYYTYCLDEDDIIGEANRMKYEKSKVTYGKVFREVAEGKSYKKLESEYKPKLIFDIAANARNFISIFKKLGFAWVQEGRGVTISSAGRTFMNSKSDEEIKALLEKQLIKWQLYNPSLPKRYEKLRMFPFLFLLKVLLKLDKPQVSKEEYALFLTKAVEMEQIDEIIERIERFRQLSKEERKSLTGPLSKAGRKKPRSIYEELLDSAGKEIGFLTIAGPCRKEVIDGAFGIALFDRERAEQILKAVGENPTFIDFKTEEDWFNYYGDVSKGPTIENAIEYYTEIGKLKEAKKIAITDEQKTKVRTAIVEKDIEDYFSQRLELVEEGLRLYYEEEKSGKQYSTEIGIIDILAISGEEFVVIEFKRDKTSDEAIGQLLRYMGWVHMNLANRKRVRGIIIAKEFDDKIKYAIIGTQNKDYEKIFKLFQHDIRIGKVAVKV
jgi:hypothetical protein